MFLNYRHIRERRSADPNKNSAPPWEQYATNSTVLTATYPLYMLAEKPTRPAHRKR